MNFLFRKANMILLKVIPFVIAVLGLKLLVHYLAWEIVPLNAVFSGIVGATVFLLGFLLNGVMTDFKESEKLPGEIAGILLSISDEMDGAWAGKKSKAGREGLGYIRDLGDSLLSWFHKKTRTKDIMGRIADLTSVFASLEKDVPPNYIARIKQEQNNLRKAVIRVHTIRETDFISSAYLIGTSTSVMLVIGLILSKFEPFYESLFFVGVISYLLFFLLTLIRDLDNPFGYYEKASSEDVSLQPLEDAVRDLSARLEEINGNVRIDRGNPLTAAHEQPAGQMPLPDET